MVLTAFKNDLIGSNCPFCFGYKSEALFVAQLLCDGGINKYDLSCAGLTANLLADNLWSYGLRDEDYDGEGNVIEPENENEGEAEN
ncbi:hypothetical protein BD0139_11750 [Helicobacter pylori]